MPADEDMLIAALKRGDASAFETLVRDHAGRMLAVSRRYLPNEDDARDAVQEALLSAFKAIGEFSGQSRISTWLHRIVVNASLMKLRRRAARPEQSIDDLLPTFLADGHNANPAAVWSESVSDAVDRAELRQFVRDCIAQLPESYRVVLMMRDIDGLESEEAAAALGIQPNALKTRLHRARQALRTLLDARFRGQVP